MYACIEYQWYVQVCIVTFGRINKTTLVDKTYTYAIYLVFLSQA